VNAATLLADLQATGITLTRTGDRLHYRTRPGVSIAPYREHIAANKPALFRELVQREIVAAATAEPAHFDQKSLDELHQQLRPLPDPEAQVAALVEQLEAGWEWLAANPDHPEAEAFLARWMARLRQYERAYAASRPRGTR